MVVDADIRHVEGGEDVVRALVSAKPELGCLSTLNGSGRAEGSEGPELRSKFSAGSKLSCQTQSCL